MADVLNPLDELHSGCTREMARIQSERDALKAELAEAKEYTQRLRVTRADVLALIPDGEMKTFAKKVLAGEIRS